MHSAIALFLALVLLCGVVSSCAAPEETKAETSSAAESTSATESEGDRQTESEPDGFSSTEGEEQVMSDSETTTIPAASLESTALSDSKTETDTDTEGLTEETTVALTEDNKTEESESEETERPSLIDGEYAALIENANYLKNGVQAGFTDASRDHFALENGNMSFTYALKNENSQLVSALKNKKGAAYITDTMDVFVRMNDGNTYFASGSTSDATANLYRIGMYYYEARFEEQDFMNGPELIEGDPFEGWGIDASASHNIEANDDGTFVISDSADPYMVLNDLAFSSKKVNMLKIRLRAVKGTKGTGIVFFIAGGATHFSPEQSVSFAFDPSGEYQDIYIPLYKNTAYSGNVTSLRIDVDGNEGDVFEIESITPARLDIAQMTPQALSLCRSFMVYSDKMHHDVQIAATATVKNIVEVGMLTVIDEDTVAKLILKDANGHHEGLEGVDWGTLEYVGFDIKGVGIFGYILPVHENAGRLTVTLLDGQYRIEQTRAPENGVINPSEEGSENANDFHLSQRIYTDGKHSFDAFIKEAEIERNPIDKHIKISETEYAKASFLGYDPIRGIYVIRMDGPSSFNEPFYLSSNRHYTVELKIKSPDDRNIYVMTLLNSGALECAVVLGQKNVLLPIPVEVCKNFSEKSGERNLFNIDDPDYSESFLPLALRTDDKYSLTIVDLYQNWGKYPLKQISSIQFYAPYYHLSTGVTETNCILPWYKTKTDVTLNTLPDFRSMSAPLWEGQPQHNSAGAHSWLEYTDADGSYSATENNADYIDSYGPTYADVTMYNKSDDGRIKATYTHMEMPQTDENRTYYTVRYEVLEDISIADFKRDFIFYSVTDNEPASTADYRQIGYLNENNECVTAESNLEADSVKEYVLGDLCPYFSMFDMPYDASPDGYANVACLIYSSEIVIGGQESDADFIIINSYNKISLSLNLESVELKTGDSFTLNMILLPWGSQESDYTDGDVNVRLVRENTLLNPLTVTSETDTVIESVYVPKVRSADGETATFTLKDGSNNVAVRAYGFKKLTVPTLYELIGGEWVKVELSSATTPDKSGYYHHYDGYMVHYDGDGTYSYSFVTDMENGKERTFKLDASKEVVSLPSSGKVSAPDYLDVYFDANEIKNLIDASAIYSPLFSNTVLSEDASYVSLYANQAVESFFMIKPDKTSGQYIVVKYRIPETNTQRFNNFEFFFSTSSANPVSGENIRYSNLKQDGRWHVAVIDASTFSHPTFSPNENGEYAIQYVRFDVINKPELAADNYIDLAFFGICDTLEEVCKLTSEEFDEIDFVTGGGELPLDTETCTPIIKSYIDPSSGYKQTSLAYYSMIDTVDGVTVHATGNSAEGIFVVSDYTKALPQSVTVGGWVIAEGGIDHLVWSADGGKTWNKITATLANANDAIVNHAQLRLSEALGKTFRFADDSSSRVNVAFQSPKLTLDLSAYAGETFDMIIAAVPANETDSLCLLACIENLTVSD